MKQTGQHSSEGKVPASHPPPYLLLFSLLLLAACQTVKIDRPTAVSDADWLMAGDSPQHENWTTEAPPPPLEKLWEYNAGAAFGTGSAIMLEEGVLVATRKGEIHYIDLESGKKRGARGFGTAVDGMPALGGGMLFVPLEWDKYGIKSYDLRRARERWRIRGADVEAGLLYYEDLLFAADMRGRVRAYEPRTGEIIWERMVQEHTGFYARPVIDARGHLVVANDAGDVAALDPKTGDLIWTHQLPAPVYQTPTAGTNLLYLSTTRGLLTALDPTTGSVRWEYALADTNTYLASPAFTEDQLVVAGADGWVRALDPQTGHEQWAVDVRDAVTAPPLLTPDTIYLGTMGREVLALDRATGAVVWEYEVRGRIKSAMAARDGRLVVLSEPRTVYLFGPAQEDTYADSK